MGTGEGMSLSARPDGAVAAKAEVVIVTDEAEEFTAFYQREYRGMLRLALALASNRGVAEELTQDAFMTLLAHWGSVRKMDNPRAWVRRVLSNRATSHRRRLRVERRAAQAQPPARGQNDRETVLSGDSIDVWQAVRRLPRRQAQAVALRYALDLSRAEVAEVMACSEETVKTHLDRARRALEASLQAERGV